MARQRKKHPTKVKTSTPAPISLKLTLPARSKTTKTASTSQIAVEVDKELNLEPANPASQLVPASALPVSQPVPAAPAVLVAQPVPAAPLPVPQAMPAVVTEPTAEMALASAFNHLHDERMDQDIEFFAAAIPHPVESPPGSKLLEDFFTLEDSQDESEIAIPPTQKPKQSKRSQEKAELEEKAQRK
jgi:hypothetical protein